MRIIPDENKRAIELLNEGNISKSLRNDLCILGKYYKDNFGNNKEKIKKFLEHFCEWRIINYNKVLYFDIIKSATNYSFRHKLFVAKPVEIIDSELEKINNIKDGNKNEDREKNLKKMLFTILVLSKLYNQKIESSIQNKKISENKKEKLKKTKYFFRESFGEICRLSNINANMKIREELLIDLYKKELVYVSNNATYKPLIIEENYNKENVKMEITTFKSLGLQYLKHIKENGIITCKKCGEMIIQKSPKQKYCPQCAKEIHKQIDREYQREKYSRRYSKKKNLD